MNKKSLVYPVFFMFAVTAVFTLALAVLNHSTKEVISHNQNMEKMRKILYVFDLYRDGMPEKEIIDVFAFDIKSEKNEDGEEIYIYEKDGEIKAYGIPFSGPGLWGSITGYIGLNKDLNKVTGIEFLTQSETPGLGGRISEPFYKEQFRGIDISSAGEKYIINRPAPGGNIDAISGATQTSAFVEKMINRGIEKFIEEGGVADVR